MAFTLTERKKHIMKLTHTKKSYIHVIYFGTVIGLITELLNLFPNDDLWGWSSIAGSFVFWILSTTFVIYFSSSNKNAMINTFLYLSSMCIAYYVLQGIVDYFTPNVTVDKFIHWDHLFYWVGISALCGIVAYILFYWNKKTIFSNILYALPVAGMLVDTINNCMKFYYSQTNLANSILGVVGLVIMLIVLLKKTNKKEIFVLTLIVVSLVGFILFPTTSQSITSEATITCELNGESEVFYIKMRDDGKILEIEGNESVYEEIDINSLKTVPEVIHALQDYYESNGGTWKFE